MNKRIEWIDQVKGFAIFLVVYGHNFPIAEKYIYGFHMPLFFLIAGFFHPKNQDFKLIKKRIKQILIPYFLWSFILFFLWLFLGRFFGDSLNMSLSPIKNFIGIFYAQGDAQYMNWGIPMWFLPTIFLTFLTFYFIRKIKPSFLYYVLLISLPIIGFVLPNLIPIKFIWSLDVALVALIFYTIGFYSLSIVQKITKKQTWVILLISGIIHVVFFNLNVKIDMYRSVYGNIGFFLISGFSGSIFYLLLFKLFPKFKFLSYIGKFTIPILAMQLRAMTAIKMILLFVFGVTVFRFSETEKFIYSIVQIIIMIPILILIKRYIPILNGKIKKI